MERKEKNIYHLPGCGEPLCGSRRIIAENILTPASESRLNYEENSNKKSHTMNVLVATDGSTYGHWELNWVTKLPFVKPPRVTALHVLDSAWLRGPFRTRPEILRITQRTASASD